MDRESFGLIKKLEFQDYQIKENNHGNTTKSKKRKRTYGRTGYY